MPFKANAACRRRIPKQRHQVTNWAEYDASLRARGSLIVWFMAEAIEAWRAQPLHRLWRAAALLRAGDRPGADAAGGVRPGTAPGRGADRVRHPAAGPRPSGAGSQHAEPPRRGAGDAAAAPRRRAVAPSVLDRDEPDRKRGAPQRLVLVSVQTLVVLIADSASDFVL